MSLLRSICCLFAGRCSGLEPPPPADEREERGDLGQKEAELEKTSEDELRHMGSGEAKR